MAYSAINPTQLTPPRVALIDPRSGAISREWYRFFLSLLTATQTTQDEAALAPDVNALLASYDVMFADAVQGLESAPPPEDFSELWNAITALQVTPREEIVIPFASGGSGVTLTTTEVNVGSTAKTGGKFTISGAGLTTGKPVLIQQAVGPYTGKGTMADEAEMDQLNVAASVTSSTTITAYWSSARRVKGNFKFNYQVSA